MGCRWSWVISTGGVRGAAVSPLAHRRFVFLRVLLRAEKPEQTAAMLAEDTKNRRAGFQKVASARLKQKKNKVTHFEKLQPRLNQPVPTFEAN